MGKEELILKLKQLGFDLTYEKISYKEYVEEMTYLIRYKLKSN